MDTMFVQRLSRALLALGLALLLAACGGSGTVGDQPTAADSASGGAPTTTDAVEAEPTLVEATAEAEPQPTSEPSGSDDSQASSGTPEICLPADEISAAVGFEVRVLPEGTLSAGESAVCAYQSSDPALGAFVSIVVAPADEGEQMLQELRDEATVFLGAQAEAEAIDVGEGGYAYGSDSQSEAAAIAGDRVYSVEVVSTAQASLGDKQDAMVELLQRVMEQ